LAEKRAVSCSRTWSNRKLPASPGRIGISCEFECAVRELAPTVPQRHEKAGWAGGRCRICAAAFVACSLDAGSAALAAAGGVPPDKPGVAAVAGETPHGTGWDCANTAIATSGKTSKGFIFFRLPLIMERCGGCPLASCPLGPV
jgi:hypothetical protein